MFQTQLQNIMKIFKNTLIIAVAFLFLVACKNDKQPEVKTVETEVNKDVVKKLDANATYAKAEFTIEGMTCAIGCAKTIEKKMAKMEGVKSAKVDFGKKLAMVEYDEAIVTPASLEEAVAKTGDTYTVKDMKTVDVFSLEKKSCSAHDKKAFSEMTDEEKAACKAKCESKKMSCGSHDKKAFDKMTDAEKAACKAKCESKKMSCGMKGMKEKKE